MLSDKRDYTGIDPIKAAPGRYRSQYHPTHDFSLFIESNDIL
jgi:hypothetical protein